MTTATPLNAVEVIEYYEVEGDVVIVAPCTDYEAYKDLPKALRFEGRVYGLTGWNSDTGRACYKAGKKFATPV